MVLHFGDGAIRGRAYKKDTISGKPEYETTDLLVLTREKKIYFLNTKVKEYESPSFSNIIEDSFSFRRLEQPGEKMIGGLRCRAYEIETRGVPANMISWYSEDWGIEIPPELMKIEAMPLLGNGKGIFMGLERGLYKGGYLVNLVNIDSLPLADSLFRIPVDYKEILVNPSGSEVDSFRLGDHLNADSAVRMAEPAVPAKKTKHEPGPVRPTHTKSKAAGRREN